MLIDARTRFIGKAPSTSGPWRYQGCSLWRHPSDDVDHGSCSPGIVR